MQLGKSLMLVVPKNSGTSPGLNEVTKTKLENPVFDPEVTDFSKITFLNEMISERINRGYIPHK